MLLSASDAFQFIGLMIRLMSFVNRRLNVLGYDESDDEGIAEYSPRERVGLRNALLKRMDLIDQYLKENPYRLNAGERNIVASWKQMRFGKYIVAQETPRYTLFLSTDNPPIAFGVLGLTDEISEMVGDYPRMVETVLLPYKDKIVHDGTMMAFNVAFGPGYRASIKESLREAKDQHGIITSLPIETPETPGTPGTPGTPETPAPPPPAAKTLEKLAAKPAAKRTGKKSLIGRWRIIEMELWDQDFVNIEEEGYFLFDEDGRGEFQFGYVYGGMDYERIEREGRPGVELTWKGHDENDPASGRGWAVLRKDGTLRGKIFFHGGFASKFTATR